MHRPTAARGVLTRGALYLGALCILLGAATLGAEAAAADELAILVEGTRGADERVEVTLRASSPGPVELSWQRIGQPESLTHLGLDRGSALRFLAPGEKAAQLRAKAPRLAGLLRRAALGPLTRAKLEIPKAQARHTHRLPRLAPGLYLVHAQRNNTYVTATALISDLALVTKRGPDKALVWAVHRKTGAPWAGVHLQVDRGTGEEKRPPLHTNAQGLAVLTGPMAPDIQILARHGDHIAFGSDPYHPAEVESHRVYTFGHQPAYRPGERVELKGIVRHYEAGRHAIDPQLTKVALTIQDASGAVVHEAEATVDPERGSFAHGFDLSKKARTGTWQVLTRIGARIHAAPLRVDAYRKPAFEVRIRPERLRALVGSEVRAGIQARFLDGGAVPNATVRWQWIYNRVDPDLFPDDEMIAAFFGTEREAFQPTTLAEGKGRLDARGRLQVSTTLPADLLDGYLSLRATVTGADRIAVAGSGGLSVAAAPLRVAVRTDRHLYGEEDVVAATIRVQQSLGGAARGRAGVLTLVRDMAGKEAPRQRWEKQVPFVTNEQGEARLEIALGGEAHYTLQVAVPRSSREPAGPAATARVGVWATGDIPTVGVSPGHLSVIADRDHYEPGDVATLLVRLPRNGQPVLTSREGARLLSHEVLDPKGGSHRIQIPIEAAHAPNLHVGFVTVLEGRLLQATAILRIPPRHALLTTRITTDDTAIEPGASTGVTIEVTERGGQAVPDVELTLAVVDDALYSLFRDPGTTLTRFFHSPRRNNVRTGALLSHTSLDRRVVQRPPAKRASVDGQPAPGGSVPPPPSAGAAPGGLGAEGAPAESAAPQPQANPAAPEPMARDEEVEEEAELSEEMADGGDDAWDGRARFGAGRGGGKKSKNGSSGRRVQKTRDDFRSTIFWAPALRTDGEGRIRIEALRFADSLTRWRLTARGVDPETRVASGSSRVVTRRLVSARLTPPRFLVEGDRAQVPLLVRNQSEQDALEIEVAAQLRAGKAAAQPLVQAKHTVERGVPTLIDLPLHAQQAAPLTLEARVSAEIGRDAERRTIPVHRAGIARVIGASMWTQNGRGSATLQIPKSAAAGSIRASVSVEPAYVQAVLSALPYLLDYPHGCTEQTMNRMGPLLDVLAAVEALEIPVTGRLQEADAMLSRGVERLGELVHGNGGYGWWPGDGASPAMTALVSRGLARARALRPKHEGVARLHARTVTWLVRWFTKASKDPARDGADFATYSSVMAALAAAGKLPPAPLRALLDTQAAYAADPLTKAQLLRTVHALGDVALTRQLAADLVDDARTAADGSLRHWQAGASSDRPVRRWQDDPIEATAEVLDALLTVGHDEPTLYEAGVRWLLAQRVGGDRWRSTRDTGAAVRFLAHYVRTTGDLGVGRAVRLRSGETVLATVQLTRESLFSGAQTVNLPAASLQPGATLELAIEVDRGQASAGIALHFFDTGPGIAAGGRGFTVSRSWFQLVPEGEGKERRYARVPVTETVASGTLLECEITVETPEARDYVMVKAPHAAGFEPARGMRGLGLDLEPSETRRERRDEATWFFFTELPAGTTTMRHYVRATHLGNFVVLPAQAELMYFPEFRANSKGELLEITASTEEDK